MTRKKKTILIILAVVIAIPLLVAVIVFSRMGTIIKIAFEKAGPHVLHVDTTLEDATVYPLKGEVTLDGMAVGNPTGYKAPTLFQAERIYVAARPTALLRKEVHVQEILVDEPQFTVEFKDGKTNIRALLDGLDSGTEEEPTPEEPETPSEDNGVRLRVDLVKITNAKVNVMVMNSPITVTLPTVELPPIADENGNGVPPSEIARAILLGVVRPIEDALKVSEVTDAIKKSIEEAGEGLKNIGDSAKEAGDQVGEDIKKTGEELKKTGSDLIKDTTDFFKK